MEPIYVDKILFQKMFGVALREAREAKGWTLMDVREHTGIATSRIEQIECGKTSIREATRVKLALTLDISESYLDQMLKVARIGFIDDLTKIWWNLPLAFEESSARID